VSYNWRVGQSRGANLIAANPQRLESADGTRWACGRNVKVSTGYRTYDGVEVWSLRTRNEAGKVIVCAEHMDRKAAEEWVSAEGIDALKRWVRNGL
jgi:hypothetical protein